MLSEMEIKRLAYLAEEAGEIVQMVGKIIRHGYESCHPDGGPSNRELLAHELGDIEAAIEFLVRSGDVLSRTIAQCSDSKFTDLREEFLYEE